MQQPRGDDDDGWLAVETNANYDNLDFLNDDQENYKAMDHMPESVNALDRIGAPVSKIALAEPIEKAVQFESMYPEDYSLLYVTSHFEPLELWNRLRQFFDETENLDPEVNEQAKLVIGHYYNTPQDCKFMTGVYRAEDPNVESIVDFRRLSGDAFLMNDFFHLVVKWLNRDEQVVQEEEDSDDEFTDEPFTDEDLDLGEMEDLDGGFEIKGPIDPHKNYLQFEYDENLLDMWIDRYNDSHMEDKDHVMKMMSFNAQLESNRNFMLQKSAESLKMLIETQLKEKKDWNSAPITRNTCLLLKNLSLSDDAVVDKETIKAVCKAMATWCPGQNASPTMGEVRESRQSMLEIAQFLQNMVANGKLDQEFIDEVMQESLDPSQMDMIVGFTTTRQEPAFQNFGNEVEKLTTATN